MTAILDALDECRFIWAISEEGMSLIARIGADSLGMEATESVLPKYQEGYLRASYRDIPSALGGGKLSIIPVRGIMTSQPSWYGTSPKVVAIDLQHAREDPEVQAILMPFNTPGGTIEGLSGLSALVRDTAKEKPVVAFNEASMASAGYWVGSGASLIISDPAALSGSIGVRASFVRADKALAKMGIETKDMASTSAPRKITDPFSKDGQSDVQAMLDHAEGLFLADVAAGRNVTKEKIVSSFGQGGMMVAPEALNVGMIDGIAHYEEAVRLAMGDSVDIED